MFPNHEQKSHQRGLIKIYLIFADFDGTLHRRTICSRAALRAGQKDLNLSEDASYTMPLTILGAAV